MFLLFNYFKYLFCSKVFFFAGSVCNFTQILQNFSFFINNTIVNSANPSFPGLFPMKVTEIYERF